MITHQKKAFAERSRSELFTSTPLSERFNLKLSRLKSIPSPKNQTLLVCILPISAASKMLSFIKKSLAFLPSEFKMRSVYFRALKMVFKSSILPLFTRSILLANICEKVTIKLTIRP